MHARPRLKPGSLPLPEDEKNPPIDPRVIEARDKGMPWIAKRLEKMTKPRTPVIAVAVTALQVARADAATAAGWVRDVFFSDWIGRCVEEAQTPAKWTQARTLYEDYLAHARFYGKNTAEKKAVVQELATETQWGRMMAMHFQKKRRSAGWYYPLTLRRSA